MSKVPGDKYYLEDGSEYSGEVFSSAEGFLFGDGEVKCSSCRGTGRSPRRECRSCSGSKTVFEQFKIYDEAGYAKLVKGRESRKRSKQNEEIRRQEVIAQAHVDYVNSHSELFNQAMAEKDNPFLQDLVAKSSVYGGLTDAQTEAMRSVISSLKESRQRYVNSVALGEVGSSVELSLTCMNSFKIQRPNFMKTDMVDVFVSELSDESGNCVMVVSQSFSPKPGEFISISGVVKEIDDKKGYFRTVVSKVKVLDHIIQSGMSL